MENIFLSILIFASMCIADDLPLNKTYLECDNSAPNGLQTTTCLLGGGGIMFLGLSILSYALDPHGTSLYLMTLGCGIFGTALTGLSIRFQIGSCKNWMEYKKCISDKFDNNQSLNINLQVPYLKLN
jgi:hypothetical protein